MNGNNTSVCASLHQCVCVCVCASLHQCVCVCVCLSTPVCVCASLSLCAHRIISEYEAFKATALKVPEESKEMMGLMDYMEQARTSLVINLHRDVDVSDDGSEVSCCTRSVP